MDGDVARSVVMKRPDDDDDNNNNKRYHQRVGIPFGPGEPSS
jgi:hypothetical protein